MATNDKNERNRLVELGGSDYKVADDNPNIKNWDVKDGTGRTFGKVDELIFNPASRKVRYLVLDLKGNEFSLKSRHVMVPIGKATLHENDDDVILSGVRAEQLDGLPTYEKGKEISPSTERHIRNHFSGTTASGAVTEEHHDDSFYEHDDFDEDRFYGNRRGGSGSKSIPIIEENVEIGKRKEETGGARIHKKIEEHDVEEKVHLREEHVDVNRNPVDRKATDKDLETFKEGEKEIRETKEVPVVNKEARVVEEVNINKEVTEDEKTIRETERKTRVDTENIDSNDRRDRDNRSDSGDRNRNLSDVEDQERRNRDEQDRRNDRDDRNNLDKRGL